MSHGTFDELTNVCCSDSRSEMLASCGFALLEAAWGGGKVVEWPPPSCPVRGITKACVCNIWLVSSVDLLYSRKISILTWP